MSTGSIGLDILLNQIQEEAISGSEESVKAIRKHFLGLSDKEAHEIRSLVLGASLNTKEQQGDVSLVVTAPPSFAFKTKTTKIVVESMIEGAKKSILITGYSLSDYFADLVDIIIKKSQSGVFVKFFVNNIENQKSFDRLMTYRGNFLKIYNYPKQEDSMSALHAKVISVDGCETLITSANLSYHGQEGNIELGTRIVSEDVAKQVEEVFTKLVFKKVFVEE